MNPMWYSIAPNKEWISTEKNSKNNISTVKRIICIFYLGEYKINYISETERLHITYLKACISSYLFSI